MNHAELVQSLLQEVPKRIAIHHSNPSSVYLSEDEMSHLARGFPIAVLLQAMTNMRGVLRHNTNLSHDKLMRALQNVAERLLCEGQDKGLYKNFSGEAHTKPAPAPVIMHTTTEEETVELQRVFQELVGDLTLESFTLRPEEAAALLAQRSLSELHAVCEAVGNWVQTERTDKLRFHNQDIIVDELFRRARVAPVEVTAVMTYE
jgi:hypothetical protein